jgi:hypothetical protein
VLPERVSAASGCGSKADSHNVSQHGGRVRFVPDRIKGQFTVMKIEKVR